MGLDLCAKGYEKEYFHMGYVGFGLLRQQIAASYNNVIGELYQKAYSHMGYKFSDEEDKVWDENCNKDLDLLLWHSDCDGKLTYKHCKRLIKVLDEIKFQCPDHLKSKGYMEKYNLLKDMIRYCAEEHKTLWFY